MDNRVISEIDNWRSGSTYTWYSSSMTAIVHCVMGRNVAVKIKGPATLYDCDGCNHNTFSGVLLWEVDKPTEPDAKK